MMLGFCGGVPGKANLGDILIAESTIDWDFGKWKPSEVEARLSSRPDPISIRNEQAHRVARSIRDRGVAGIDQLAEIIFNKSGGELKNAQIDLVPFASGSAVIANSGVTEGLQTLNESIAGVDMESYGFYYACRHSRAARPQFMCIKAVADDCGSNKDNRLHEVCSIASAEVARHIVTKEWDF